MDATTKRATTKSGILIGQHGRHHRRLEFVHIPKTAGTAVENAALEQGIRWGYFRFAVGNRTHNERTNETLRFMQKYDKLPPWHLPPCLLAAVDDASNGDHVFPTNPYYDDRSLEKVVPGNQGNNSIGRNSLEEGGNDATDLFVIVRSPYERIVSEYRYLQTMFQGTGGPTKFNRYVAKRLRKVAVAQEKQRQQQQLQQQQFFDSCRMDAHSPEYFMDFGHWIPQYDYVYRTTTTTTGVVNTGSSRSRDELNSLSSRSQELLNSLTLTKEETRTTSTTQTTQLVRHVLKYDPPHLSRDFAQLMALYGLDHVKLEDKAAINDSFSSSSSSFTEHRTPKQNSANDNEEQSLISVETLSMENIQEINRLYHKDFEVFGFERKHAVAPSN
ncbi:hypothetical protein ACA910_018317 [Epithemia clementina (nom. ined.)]